MSQKSIRSNSVTCVTGKHRHLNALLSGNTYGGLLILRWVNMCELFRVRGVATQYAELLEAAGVDTVKELRNRNSEHLATTMSKANAEKKLVRTLPNNNHVNGWIEHAKSLLPIVTY